MVRSLFATMPSVKLEALQAAFPNKAELFIAQQVFNIDKNGICTVKASKPRISKADASFPVRANSIRKAMYVWRMVVFTVSPIHQHQCMPVMAFCDLPDWPDKKGVSYFDLSEAERAESTNYRKELEKAMNDLADKIVALIPKEQWHGTRRWGRALGML